jgi:hypothetical protein
MPHDQLLDLLRQAKSAFDALATSDLLNNLSEDDFATVASAVTAFFASMQSAANRLTVLRRQDLERVMTGRERLPNRRATTSFNFEYERLSYACSFSCFADGRPAEIFLQSHKGGSHADVAAREAAIASSLALQHGCTIEVLQHAVLRNPDGSAAGALGRAIDAIMKKEAS